ncbi:MAG: GDCCVxC domain-containing (seleno)protein [Gemmatimonadales bacterium]
MTKIARITCPTCGVQSEEVMPPAACLFFGNCPACRARVRPRPGHCCVFCSYGDTLCPPRQAPSA